jgi:hypothetical protein
MHLRALLFLCYNTLLNGEVMQKIVINTDFGGFGLSDKAEAMYKAAKGIADDDFYYWLIPRDDATLIQIVEQLGPEAEGRYANLKVLEIPDGVEWHVCEYNGMEHVAEEHRTWR